jgi:carbamoyltransferase
MSAAGQPEFRDLFLQIIGDAPQVDRSYFDMGRLTFGGFSARFYKRLGLADHAPVPERLRADIAASLQSAVTEVVLRLAGHGANLCLAGGLGFNALLVAALEQSGHFENVFVQPAAGNAGTALGAVLSVHGAHVDVADYCLGPGFTAEEIKQVLENCKLRFRYLMTTDEIIDTAVAQLGEQKIVAWMQGRMEFGPRALGNRSILASPTDPYSTENLNAYIKHREAFRKFAASVPAELADQYFIAGPNARNLATVGRVRPAHRKAFEGAILADDLIRVHTVRSEDNPMYWRLLHAAGAKTGMPVLYNTSFNLFGEPLVCTPRDAVRSFYSSGIDAMFVGNFFLQK